MPLRTELPTGAIPRKCGGCGKSFRPMTDREWDNVRRLHEETSERHRLMSKIHRQRMDNDVWNRAAPGPWSGQRQQL
jgi:hypothetical protein